MAWGLALQILPNAFLPRTQSEVRFWPIAARQEGQQSTHCCLSRTADIGQMQSFPVDSRNHQKHSESSRLTSGSRQPKKCGLWLPLFSHLSEKF